MPNTSHDIQSPFSLLPFPKDVRLTRTQCFCVYILQSADKSSQNFVSTSCDWKPPSSHTLLLVTLGENNMADAQTGEMGMMIM